jgi:NADPH:quinone reductase-like Zn-dependent oxidoreductase
MMKAAVVEQYGAPDTVRIAEVPRPVPRAREVLVRVVAAAVTSADARLRGADFPAGFEPFARLAFGIRKPRRTILGGAFSGVVEAVGAKASGFASGDAVCGMTGMAMGAHAEYVAVRADRIARKPETVSHEDAAGVLFGGSTALFFLRDKVSVSEGDAVLVNGASGAIGTNAVQLAKHFGATVTAVTSGANVGLVTELGAAAVIDYTKDELVGAFDAVLDTVGTLTPASGRRLLSERGVLVLVVAGLKETIGARGNIVAGVAPERAEDFAFLLDLVASGDLTVVTEEVLPLEAIAKAYARVDSGRKVGNIIVRP